MARAQRTHQPRPPCLRCCCCNSRSSPCAVLCPPWFCPCCFVPALLLLMFQLAFLVLILCLRCSCCCNRSCSVTSVTCVCPGPVRFPLPALDHLSLPPPLPMKRNGTFCCAPRSRASAADVGISPHWLPRHAAVAAAFVETTRQLRPPPPTHPLHA